MTTKKTKKKKAAKSAAATMPGAKHQAHKHTKKAAKTTKEAAAKTVKMAQKHLATKPQNPVTPLIRKPIFGRFYALGAALLLLATTAFWAFQSALIQQGNADQLVNSFLFDNTQTFRGANLPDQHTFLFKWPLFLLVHVTGSSGASFVVWTVVVTLLTVMGLAYILYRIERRPLVFGTLWLAMASVLLLVPAQPYPGGMLPVNMAMLATRNLEYLLYIAGLVLVARTHSIRQWMFWLAVLLFAVLTASDKLFLGLGLGAAISVWALCVILRRHTWRQVAGRWLCGEVLASALAIGIIALIKVLNIVHISGAGANPYAFVGSVRELGLAGVYALLAVLTNFGANPAADTRLLWQLPAQIKDSFTSIQGMALAVNISVLLASIWAACMVLRASLLERVRHVKKEAVAEHLAVRTFVAVALCATSVVAIAEFMLTKHYYPVDARYVTIIFFALFVALSVYLSEYRRVRPELLVITGGVFLLGIAAGLGVATRNYTAEQAAMDDLTNRNTHIAQALEHHPVQTVFADYWRAFPIRLETKNSVRVTPLDDCTQPRKVLSSSVWQPDVHNHSFAYLLQLDPSTTGFPSCTEAQVEAAYGLPTDSTLIKGTLGNPKELLLFYDQGANHHNKTAPVISTTVTPATLKGLPDTSCGSTATMDIVAHQDDDLLFMNPDTQNSIMAGDCVQTVYITAGDAGRSKYYWQGRQQGAEAAYAAMLDISNEWIHRLVEITPGHYATLATPRQSTRVALLFMHLPDGNVRGEGFKTTHNQSLERLESGRTASLRTVDGQSRYTLQQLQDALKAIMQTYHPAVVRVQSNDSAELFPDHSDHRAAGRIARRAYQQYVQDTPSISTATLLYYMGYPIHAFGPNVFDEDFWRKQDIFFAYGNYDPSVCDTEITCATNPTYQAYLERQYTNDH